MRVRVDEPRRDRRPGGVELCFAVGTQVRPDLDDHAVAHAHVAALHRCPRAVDDRATAHQQISHHDPPTSDGMTDTTASSPNPYVAAT